MKTLLVIKEPDLLGVMKELLERQFGHTVTAIGTMEVAEQRVPILAAETELLIVSLNIEPRGAEPLVETARLRNPKLPVLLVAGSESDSGRQRVAKMRAAFWQTGNMPDLVSAMGRALKVP